MMMKDRRPKVCMFLLNNFAFDSRVERPAYENRDGVIIKRIGLGGSQIETFPSILGILLIPFRLILSLTFWSYTQVKLLYQLILGSAEKRILLEGHRLLGWLAHSITRVVRKARLRARSQVRYLFSIGLMLAGIVERADVYHANDMDVLLAAYLAAHLTRGRLVYDSHELWTERNVLGGLSSGEKSRLRKVEGFLIQRADSAMTVNRSIAVQLSKLYGVPEPHVVMNCPNYVDVGEMQHRSDGHIRRYSDRRALLYVGRISFNRGLEPLIEAVAQLDNVDLVMMGNGSPEYLGRLSEHASELNVTGRVYAVAPVPPDEVVPTASQADAGMVLFQNTCLSYYYSLPTKLFECIHAGLPVIVSDFPEMARVVREYDIGLACDPADPAAIADAVRELFSDPVHYEQMRQNTRAAAREFSWESEGGKLVKIYQGLMGR
jgi:glycosyltransferase involved in cell wall biosynthesis